MGAFIEISKVLHEPIAIASLVAIVFSIYLNRKNRSPVFIYVSVTILFMVAWRVGVQIISSRYASALIYPAVILVVYMFYAVIPLCGKIPYLNKIPAKLYPWISRALLIGIIIPCIVKDFRFNYYAGFIQKSSMVIKNDAANFKSPVNLDFAGEAARIGYYSEIETIQRPYTGSQIAPSKEINQYLKAYTYTHDVIYVICNELEKNSLNSLGYGEWELISSSYKNNKKKLRFSVYCFIPDPEKYFARQVSEVDYFSKNNLMSNGDFEKYHLADMNNADIKILQKRELSFFSNEDILYPASWPLNPAFGYSHTSKGEVELSEKAIQGKYSLRMSSSSLITIFHSMAYPKKYYQFQFLVCGKPGTEFAVCLYGYTTEDKYLSYQIIAELKVLSEGVYLYRIPIGPEDIAPGEQFRICFMLRHGEIFLDEVALEPVELKN